MKTKLVSPSWWCRLFGCKTYGPYYGMPQSHCWYCGMKTWHANPALNLPDFVESAASLKGKRRETTRPG